MGIKPGRRGAKPGERRGGRTKGTPNRRTTEAQLEAERTVVEAKKAGRKLGKEILDDFANLFAGMAAYYQPSPVGAPVQNPNQNEQKFLLYADLARKTAKDLAEFQSPRYRAIAIVDPNGEHGLPPGGFPQLPQPTGKAMGALEAYQLLRDKDIIDVTPQKVVPATNGKANGHTNGAAMPKKANGHG